MILVALGGTLQLRHCFNARSDDAARILMVVSPTCPDCLRRVSVVAAAAGAVEATSVRLLVLWTAMRPGDCASAAAAASAAFDRAAGFAHFWEDDGWPISTALRPLLGLATVKTACCAWGFVERTTGFEPATLTLAIRRLVTAAPDGCPTPPLTRATTSHRLASDPGDLQFRGSKLCPTRATPPPVVAIPR
jgi:hypothetical protein